MNFNWFSHFGSHFSFSINPNGRRKRIAWENISMNAVNTTIQYRTCTFVRWWCNPPTKTTWMCCGVFLPPKFSNWTGIQLWNAWTVFVTISITATSGNYFGHFINHRYLLQFSMWQHIKVNYFVFSLNRSHLQQYRSFATTHLVDPLERIHFCESPKGTWFDYRNVLVQTIVLECHPNNVSTHFTLFGRCRCHQSGSP